MPDSLYFAGLDIGGTTIKAVLVDALGQPASDLVEVRSHGHQGYRKTFAQLHAALDALCQQASIDRSQVAAAGLDVPAPTSHGVIWGKANLSADWVGVNIRDEFSAELSRPVFMTNDGNAAAFGEWSLRPDHDGPLLFVAPGTGLGGGFVLPGGMIYEGANGLAMEIGGLSVPHRDDRGKLPAVQGKVDGALEGWVSLMAIRRELEIKLSQKKYREHPLAIQDSEIAEKAFQLRDYAEQGDTLALEIFGRQAHVLGFAMADQASELDPGLIVIGGGLAETKFRDWFLQEVIQSFEDHAPSFYVRSPIPPHPPTTRFEWAIGGDGSAALGVARKAIDLAPS